MRILHTADLHLGSPLRAAAARDGAEALRLAAGGVLARIVDVALARQVDALVLAGDVFDSDVADLTLRARLVAQLRRATQGGVPVVMIRGNHDALMDLDRFGAMGEGIHLLTREAPSVRLGDATFHGLSFDARHAKASMLPDYPAPAPGLNVGLMHTSLDGAAGHDPYAPCATADLLAHGYDYWALGHIHKSSTRMQDGVAVVMPGIPQGRHAGEAGVGAVMLATLGDGAPGLQAIPVADVAFETVEVDLTALDQGAMIAAFAGAVPQGGPHRLLRFRVRGSALPASVLEAMAQAALEDAAGAAFEALRIDTRPAATDGDALGALAGQEAATDSFRDEVAAILADLRAALPKEARDAVPEDALDALIDEGLAEAALALSGRAS